MNPAHDLFLQEMGLGPRWRLRGAAAEAPAAAPPVVVPAGVPAQDRIDVAVPVPVPFATVPADAAADAAAGSDPAGMDWDELRSTVASCRKCGLCEARQQAVLGVGDVNADWLFVGEGPGAEEDQRGEPFVGQAGKLLDNMLAAIGLRRGADVYIANAVKCRPPGNRTPAPDETAACLPYLQRQIGLIRPRLIVALGRPAAQTLLQEEVKVGAARGRLHDCNGIPVIVTYHPAYLLRTLPDKARAWEDLCFMRRTMSVLKGA